MKRIVLLMLLVASAAHAGGVVLGPPPEPPTSSSSPSDPLPQETIDCIVDALTNGLDPVEECDL
tara:strand:+ start:1585 stop:1776 length:192 start_codon:yes stop_codon:yes gene_type:complete